jgi:DHA2 family multidrug resistance protein
MMSAEVTGINRPAITACVILATLMQALDTTIANVASPPRSPGRGASRFRSSCLKAACAVRAADRGA